MEGACTAMKLSASVIAATLAIAPSLPSTLAWGAFGHQVIAYLASQFVTQETQTFCQNILSDTSADYLATVSTWADSFRVTSAGRFSAPFHFIDAHDNPPTSCGVDFNRDCKAAGCVVSALTNYVSLSWSKIVDTILKPRSWFLDGKGAGQQLID